MKRLGLMFAAAFTSSVALAWGGPALPPLKPLAELSNAFSSVCVYPPPTNVTSVEECLNQFLNQVNTDCPGNPPTFTDYTWEAGTGEGGDSALQVIFDGNRAKSQWFSDGSHTTYGTCASLTNGVNFPLFTVAANLTCANIPGAFMGSDGRTCTCGVNTKYIPEDAKCSGSNIVAHGPAVTLPVPTNGGSNGSQFATDLPVIAAVTSPTTVNLFAVPVVDSNNNQVEFNDAIPTVTNGPVVFDESGTIYPVAWKYVPRICMRGHCSGPVGAITASLQMPANHMISLLMQGPLVCNGACPATLNYTFQAY